jgi:hypothetical protein
VPTFGPLLSVHNRGGRLVEVLINDYVHAAVGCGDTVEFVPGTSDLPALPWVVEVRTSEAGRVLHESIDAAGLPLWLGVISGKTVVRGRNGPMSGPYVPCPSG